MVKNSPARHRKILVVSSSSEPHRGFGPAVVVGVIAIAHSGFWIGDACRYWEGHDHLSVIPPNANLWFHTAVYAYVQLPAGWIMPL